MVRITVEDDSEPEGEGELGLKYVECKFCDDKMWCKRWGLMGPWLCYYCFVAFDDLSEEVEEEDFYPIEYATFESQIPAQRSIIVSKGKRPERAISWRDPESNLTSNCYYCHCISHSGDVCWKCIMPGCRNCQGTGYVERWKCWVCWAKLPDANAQAHWAASRTRTCSDS